MDTTPVVRHFRQILIGPFQLAPLPASSGIQHSWDFLAGADSPWREVEDEFTADPDEFLDAGSEVIVRLWHVFQLLF